MIFLNQKSLPVLPLPELNETCVRYLRSVEPLLSGDEFKKTTASVSQFCQCNGLELQKQLSIIHQTSKTSYVHQFWEDRYLESRLPLPVNWNVGCLLTRDQSITNLPFSQQVSISIISALHYYLNVKKRELGDPDKITIPSQYASLFGTSRIPGIKRDLIIQTCDPQHVIILYKDTFYVLETFHNQEIVDVDVIEKQINWILNQTKHQNPAIGLFTTQPRLPWSLTRKQLQTEDISNRKALEKIVTSCFIICLDDHGFENDRDILSNTLHGNGRNRWFDHSLQFILTPDGHCGINFEHTRIDGCTISDFCVKFQQERIKLAKESIFSNAQLKSGPIQLNWKLNKELSESLKYAEKKAEAFTTQTQTFTSKFEDFGKGFAESKGGSTDAIVQIALQLAYYQKFKRVPSVYQPIQTRQYLNGRTEGMRSATVDSVNYIRLSQKKIPREIQWQALKKAVHSHVNIQRECRQGKGAERHLFALKTLSEWQGQGTLAEIFLDTGYSVYSTHDLSTSSLYDVPELELFTFGPATRNGFGVSYIIKDGFINFNITSIEQNACSFFECFNQALLNVGKLIRNHADFKM